MTTGWELEADDSPGVAVSERANDATTELSELGASGVVRALRACDAQLFRGWRHHAGLADAELHVECADLAARCASCLRENGVVLLVGAGTSGRLALAAALAFDNALRAADAPGAVRHCLAGGHRALFGAVELAEDDAAAALRDAAAALEGAPSSVVVGVTCGLSATYAGAALELVLARPPGTSAAALLGFSPVGLARTARIPGWRGGEACFRDVASEVARRADAERAAGTPPERRACFVLTPVVGPEAVTGSTRLKGGSGTKVLLEAVLGPAVGALARVPVAGAPAGSTAGAVRRVVRCHRAACDAVYDAAEDVAQLVRCAAAALRAGGRVRYAGAESLGLYAAIDASEQVPTFGARPTDVVGYVDPGWAWILPPELAADPRLKPIGLDALLEELPALGPDDLVVAVTSSCAAGLPAAAVRRIADVARINGTAVALLDVRGEDDPGAVAAEEAPPWAAELVAGVRLPAWLAAAPLLPGLCAWEELAVKLALNAVSTGAHVLVGKVLGNRMIDVRVSNHKLFHRAARIVAGLARVGPEAARAAVIRAAHGLEAEPTEELLSAPEETHVRAAVEAARVVPTATLLATGRFTLGEARTVAGGRHLKRSLAGALAEGRQREG